MAIENNISNSAVNYAIVDKSIIKGNSTVGRFQQYRNIGTTESPIWEKFFNKTIAEAVKMGDNDDTSIKDYVDGRLNDILNTNELFSSLTNRQPKVSNYAKYLDIQRTGKIYQTKVWKYSYNPSSECEKTLDNAGLVCEPSTDTVEGRDDYADIPLFDWFHCNYIRKDNGDIEITAMEGEENYSETGSVDVGTTGMTFYWNWDTESSEEYSLLTISDSPNDELGLVPWVESVNADGSINPYYVHSTYCSTTAEDGLLRSQPYKKMEYREINNHHSYTNMITNYQKKGSGYWGAGVCRHTFQLIFAIIKYATKDPSKYIKGLIKTYIFSAAVERNTEDIYFPVTATDANNISIGEYVSVGYGINNNGTLSSSCFMNNMNKYVDTVKILKIEDMDDGNKAVYLDIDKGFTTIPVQLTDTLSSPIYISPAIYIGYTNEVISKHDGSPISNTSGKFPYRIQGTEYYSMYDIASDVVIYKNSDDYVDIYIAEKGIPHSSDIDIIKNTYKLVDSIYYNGSNYFIGDIDFDINTGIFYPCSESESSNFGYCDIVSGNISIINSYGQYLLNRFSSIYLANYINTRYYNRISYD